MTTRTASVGRETAAVVGEDEGLVGLLADDTA
jgi:hypothetical protein